MLGDSMSKTEKRARAMIKERTEEMRAGIEKAGKDLKAGVEKSADRSRKSIQKRPLTSVAVAAGAAVAVGIVAGALMTRKGKKDTKKQQKG
jgi:ElaB/YqjD/DUF883 family membrane-anchored ribosome-binding protein